MIVDLLTRTTIPPLGLKKTNMQIQFFYYCQKIFSIAYQTHPQNLVPYGKIGRINDWNNSSDNCHVSLKAAFVLLAVGLQKSGPKSKAKDHQDALAKRLILWREGEISKLLRECRIIQRRIGKLKISVSPDKTKVFEKLVLEGQINAALRFVSESSSGGVLSLTDGVMAQLKVPYGKIGRDFID